MPPTPKKARFPQSYESAPFRRLKGIFPGGLIKVGLQRFISVVGDSIAIYWLVLCYRLLQYSCKSNLLGSFGLLLSGTAILSPCSGSHGNYLNRIHFEIGNSVCCVNPSFSAYFNSVICSFVYNIGIISLKFTADFKICSKFSDNSCFIHSLSVCNFPTIPHSQTCLCLFYRSSLSTAAP